MDWALDVDLIKKDSGEWSESPAECHPPADPEASGGSAYTVMSLSKVSAVCIFE